MLHVFADDFGALEKWVEIAYRLAAPEALSVKMDVYVDDMWQSYIFNEDFSFFRDVLITLNSRNTVVKKIQLTSSRSHLNLKY